ncbi:MAG: YdbL family protein [Candidatus Omnitrophica bacterium]|nr:YdbL family protein [Candidatus Omnitrophota bacterium]MCM8831310.1 YdbL family protein [Candidatus Omnitrophota bacterium]
MKKLYLLGILSFLVISCAKVQVQAPKEPIKVDITMRLDVYQHIIKDIDAIEDIVSGRTEKPASNNIHKIFNFLIDTAYAQQLTLEIEEAALRRKNRLAQLESLQQQGIVGENRFGFVEIRTQNIDDTILKLVESENNDRKIIYQALAKKNKVSVENIQELYAKKLQESAPSGTPIEVLDVTTGEYVWKVR